jgi:hypothetical protein
MIPFSPEQASALVNLRQAYEQWIDALRDRDALPYGMRFVTRNERQYLYEFRDRTNNGRSLGPRDSDTEQQLSAFSKDREDSELRIKGALERLRQNSRICRALYVPLIAEEAGQILVEIDRRRMLGTYCMVAGTNAALAYNLEAGGPVLGGADIATNDFDILWSRERATSLVLGMPETLGPGQSDFATPSLLGALKEIDETYTVNDERPFQIRNRGAYEVEVLVPPSQLETLPKGDRLRPARNMHELEWLLKGTPVVQVTPVRGDGAARIIAPDPRMFALQKFFISEKPTRDSLKKDKDRRQAGALLDACLAGHLPRHPLNDDFTATIPNELVPHWNKWANARRVKQLTAR